MKPDKPWSAPPPEILKQLDRAGLPCMEELQAKLLRIHLSIISRYLDRLVKEELEVTHEMAIESMKELSKLYHLLLGK